MSAKFKILNFLSGGMLGIQIYSLRQSLRLAQQALDLLSDESETNQMKLRTASKFLKRAQTETDNMFDI